MSEGARELVQRLRAHVNSADLHVMDRLMVEAAYEIERTEACFQGVMKDNADLAKEIERLRAALQCIAVYGDPDFEYGDTYAMYFEQVRDTARKALGPAHETAPAKDEVLEAIRAGRVTYPPEVLPTGRWMPADETTGKPLGGYTCGACGRSFHYDEKHNCETCAGQETAACICRPVGAGDGDTYVPNPRCKAHK